jgi:uncharacterized membrane protein
MQSYYSIQTVYVVFIRLHESSDVNRRGKFHSNLRYTFILSKGVPCYCTYVFGLIFIYYTHKSKHVTTTRMRSLKLFREISFAYSVILKPNTPRGQNVELLNIIQLPLPSKILRWISVVKRWLELAKDRGTEELHLRLLPLNCDNVIGKGCCTLQTWV